MNIEDVLNQAALDNTKKALSTAVSQCESLFGLLDVYLDQDVVEKIKTDFMQRIENDLKGVQ